MEDLWNRRGWMGILEGEESFLLYRRRGDQMIVLFEIKNPSF